jgi:hypothetical protein
MLTERIIDTVFIIPIAERITSHVRSNLEGEITILRTERNPHKSKLDNR